MADPIVLVAAVRAALRLYQAGDNALSQKMRDEAVVFPKNPAVFFRNVYDLDKLERDFNGPSPLYRDWISARRQTQIFQDMMDGDATARLTIVQSTMAYHKSKTGDVHAGLGMVNAEFEAIEQWSENDRDKPVSPFTRFALVLADVAAEFVALNPGLVSKGGRGEKLIGTFAGQIAELIPNDEKFGSRQRLGSRLLGSLLRAGLETTAEHKDLFTSKAHEQELVDALVGPILREFPENMSLSDELDWQATLDAFAGPALSAAFGVLAENQKVFLGSGFATDTLLGELNRQLLLHLRDNTVSDAFTRDGMVELYRAALGVIAEKPELVLSGGALDDAFVETLISNFATTLSDPQLIAAKDRKTYGLALSIAALEAFKGHADALLGLGDEPLQKIASDTLQDVLGALTEGLAQGKRLDEVFGKGATLQMVKDVLTLLAEHPDLLADREELKLVLKALSKSVTSDRFGKSFAAELIKTVLTELAEHSNLAQEHKEVEGILNALATAVSADKSGLLAEEDWRRVFSTALREAAQNPGRLFGLTPGDPETELAVVAITTLLEGAADGINGDRSNGGVLFGDTLRQAVEVTLSAIASNPARAAEIFGLGDEINQVSVFIEQISAVVRIKPDGVHFAKGAKEWLRIYRAILMRFLAKMDVPILIEDDGKTLTPLGEALIEDILATAVPLAS